MKTIDIYEQQKQGAEILEATRKALQYEVDSLLKRAEFRVLAESHFVPFVQGALRPGNLKYASLRIQDYSWARKVLLRIEPQSIDEIPGYLKALSVAGFVRNREKNPNFDSLCPSWHFAYVEEKNYNLASKERVEFLDNAEDLVWNLEFQADFTANGTCRQVEIGTETKEVPITELQCEGTDVTATALTSAFGEEVA